MDAEVYYVMLNNSKLLSYGDARDTYLRLLPEDLHDAVTPLWGLNEEGELTSLWREIGGRGPKGKKLAGLWSILGNLAMGRFHSKHIALRGCFSLRSEVGTIWTDLTASEIKAYEEGIFGERY